MTENINNHDKIFPPNRWIIDPSDVRETDAERVKKWCLGIMSKHEHRFTSDVPNRRIVYKGEVEPEDIDIRNVYPFPNLNWFIHKQMFRGKDGLIDGWFITLLSTGEKHSKLLFRLGPYVKV